MKSEEGSEEEEDSEEELSSEEEEDSEEEEVSLVEEEVSEEDKEGLEVEESSDEEEANTMQLSSPSSPGISTPSSPWGDKHSDQRQVSLDSGMRVDWDLNEKEFIKKWLQDTRTGNGKPPCSSFCYQYVLESKEARSIFHAHHVMNLAKFQYMFQIVVREERKAK